ncbi:MAG TPA: glycosyltransferase family 2 protein [Steroidobacteraceae bacterium]|jgi:glycosyltransferase involved in cell wall biosynthesis
MHAQNRYFEPLVPAAVAPTGVAEPARTPRLGIVVPCFNETEVLPETSRRLTALLDRLIASGQVARGSQIVYVDDGSRDGTWQLIEILSQADERIGGIKLSRNRGHQNALLAGLFTVDADVLISVDADLQDDIDVMSDMLTSFSKGAHVVYGVRKDRTSDGFFKRATAQGFYCAIRALGVESVYNHADFRLMSRDAVAALKKFGEVNLFLRGIVPLLGYRSDIVYYTRSERFAGVSKYPLRKMLALALDGVTSFSVVPLRFITAVGFVVFLASVAMGMWTLWVRLFTDDAVPGWTSTLLPIYFLGGIQILCIGILGEYLGKVYQETKQRPRFIIEKLL